MKFECVRSSTMLELEANWHVNVDVRKKEKERAGKVLLSKCFNAIVYVFRL